VNFVHVSLLAGGAFALLPFLLHFLGRRVPKKVTFPALRFVRQTAIQSQRGWTIKRWLLLFMRVLLILLLAAMLASPRVHSSTLNDALRMGLTMLLAILATATAVYAYASRHSRTIWSGIGILALGLWLVSAYGLWRVLAWGSPPPNLSSSGPICAAIVLDTSPSMDYRHANVSRLETAKETARWIMDRLPNESQIGIVTSSQAQRLHPNRISANRQLDHIQIEGRSSNLMERTRAAIDLVRNSKMDRREVYVLSDMANHAWSQASDSSSPLVAEAGSADSPVLIQLIDVSASKPENWSLLDTKLSQEVVVVDGTAEVTAQVVASPLAPTAQLAVELLVEKRDSKLPIIRNGQMVVPGSQVVDRQIVDVPAGGSSKVRFNLRHLEAGTTHAVLQLTRPDPLDIDNRVAITLEATKPGKRLVLGRGDEKTGNQAATAAKMLDPTLEMLELAYFDQLSSIDPSHYEAILMIDPPSLPESEIKRLQEAVRSGCGLMMVLGRAFQDEREWNQSPTAKLLPGKVTLAWRRPMTDDSHYFVTQRNNHPIWAIYDQAAAAVPWNQFPVFRYWVLDSLSNDADVLMRYSVSGHPAVIEQSLGSGRILVVTTPMTDVDSTANPPWNLLFAGSNAWPNFGLMEGSMRYVSRMVASQRNFKIGELPRLDNPVDLYPGRYDLFSPLGEVVRVQAQANVLSYNYAAQPGTYRLRSVQADKSAVRGFSMQLESTSVDMRLVERPALDSIFGANGYSWVKDLAHLQSSIGQARYGKDLSPFLLVVLFLLFVAEQAMSYRFYSLTAKR
jgi:hypothetical protein